MLLLIQIPAMGCDAGLYAPFNQALDFPAQIILPTADRMADCVQQVLVQAPETFVVMGTSFGGRVALETTLAAPDRVKGLIVTGASAGPVADQAAGLRRSARIRGGEFENVLEEMSKIIAHLPGPRGKEAVEAFRAMSRATGAEVFAAQSDAMAYRDDVTPRLQEISCPVLCLWGEHDKFAAVEAGQEIATAVPEGKCLVLKDCGHLPTLEYPAEAAEAVKEWLKALASSTGRDQTLT